MTSGVKQHFISRYKPGMIMEADYSQLEIIVLAHLTGDQQLRRDILDGVDMHTVRAAEMFRIPESAVTKEQRTLAKRFSFQLQYGSGARNMAEKNGTDVETAQAFINAYYARYPDVKNWQDAMLDLAKERRQISRKRTPANRPAGIVTFSSETGRRYTLTETDAPDWMIARGTRNTSFKPTELKNYPIQGTATGDIVPMMVGKIFRWLKQEGHDEYAKLVNTVHDSVVLDVREDMCYPIGVGLKKLMENAPIYYENIFGKEFSLPLKVEVTWGPNWMEQTQSLT